MVSSITPLTSLISFTKWLTSKQLDIRISFFPSDINKYMYIFSTEIIEEESDDEEYVEPMGTSPLILDVNQPLEDPRDSFQNLSMEETSFDEVEEGLPLRVSSDVLFLVVHGGSGLQQDMIDSANHDIDFRTLRKTMDEVLRTHYQFAQGRVTIKLVPCSNIGTKAYNLLCSLSPSIIHSLDRKLLQDQNSTPNFSFPICVLPLLAAEDPAYISSLRQLTQTANVIYRDFLESVEGRNFNGHVCFLGDCLGSVMIYDILAHSCDHTPSTTPTSSRRIALPNTSSDRVTTTISSKRTLSPMESVGRTKNLRLQLNTSPDLPIVHSPSPVGEMRSPDELSVTLMFDVSSVFMFGSPLGYLLSLRQLKNNKCECFYI